MDRNRLRTGSVAVLFLVVIISLVMFSVLSSVTAVRSMKASNRYAEHMTEVYETESIGQEWLKELDSFLKGNGTLLDCEISEDGILVKEIKNGNVILKAVLVITGDTYRITEWSIKTEWEDKYLNLL